MLRRGARGSRIQVLVLLAYYLVAYSKLRTRLAYAWEEAIGRPREGWFIIVGSNFEKDKYLTPLFYLFLVNIYKPKTLPDVFEQSRSHIFVRYATRQWAIVRLRRRTRERPGLPDRTCATYPRTAIGSF
jgi:hypothetical protein